MSGPNQTYVDVDVRSEVCPLPAMRAVDAMEQAHPDEVIHILLDHAPALDTIPAQATRLGWAWQVEETGSPEWRITLTRRAP